jgi:hypothetical protein
MRLSMDKSSNKEVQDISPCYGYLFYRLSIAEHCSVVLREFA